MEIKVSENFIQAYRNFNVVNVTESMKDLDQKELYLFLLLCLDKFDSDDPVVKYNFQPFQKEVMELFDIQDDRKSDNHILNQLGEETGDKYIETDIIRTPSGDTLPEPLNKQQVREEKIKIINSIDNQN